MFIEYPTTNFEKISTINFDSNWAYYGLEEA